MKEFPFCRLARLAIAEATLVSSALNPGCRRRHTAFQLRGCCLHYLALIVIFAACNPSREHYEVATPPPKPVYFSKNWQAEIGFQGYQAYLIHRADDGSLVALLQSDNGLLRSNSSDIGATWTPPRLIFEFSGVIVPIFDAGLLIGVQTLTRVTNGGQLFFHRRVAEDWSESSPIRDTHWGEFTFGSFAADTLGTLYCIWADGRNGNFDIYFSSSLDGGKTWRSNVRVDDDLSGQEQGYCLLLTVPNGTLFAIWQDNRNPKTLFDIYCSWSADGGQTWSANNRVNDDTTYAWQVSPSAALAPNGEMFVVWDDYRDQVASGDRRSNIYFAYSHDAGKSWGSNVRISHARFGQNELAKLVASPNGLLLCAWRSADYNLAGDLLFAYSTNGGHTSNIWFSFRSIAKGGALNYFIDDSLVIATDKLSHGAGGQIGIGAALGAPAYFKEITVTSIK